jgi:hypothetical protein
MSLEFKAIQKLENNAGMRERERELLMKSKSYHSHSVRTFLNMKCLTCAITSLFYPLKMKVSTAENMKNKSNKGNVVMTPVVKKYFYMIQTVLATIVWAHSFSH